MYTDSHCIQLAPNGARPVRRRWPCRPGRAGDLRARPWPAAMPRLARQACEFSVVDITNFR